MKQELEIEFKNLLSATEFASLTAAFHITDFHEQTNTYFDTADGKIKALGGALRIRTKQTHCECTLKLPNPDGEGLLEFTQSLPQALASTELLLAADQVLTQLEQYQILADELQLLTSLTTKRCEIPYHDGLLVFDESFYSDQHDFELEFEYPEFATGQRLFEELLQTYQIPHRETPNKIKRAMAALAK